MLRELRCPACGQVKTEDMYHKSSSKRGVQAHCKQCQKRRHRERRENNPELFRTYNLRAKAKARETGIDKVRLKRWRLKTMYGLEYDEYMAMLQQQNRQCKICNKDLGDNTKHIHVDHCHVNGHVRGILCHNCNKGLGNFMDDIDLMLKAVEYLKENKEC